MLELGILAWAVVLVIGVPWTIGFVRAARVAPVKERLKSYCAREDR